MAQFAKLSPALAAAINLARQHAGDDDRKAVKKEMFAAAKAQFGIPADVKVKCETSNTVSPDYLVLKRSADGQPFMLDDVGLWVDAPAPQVQAQPRVTRWFKVGRVDMIEAAKDVVLGDGADWDDDCYNSVAATADEVTPGLRKSSDGTFYVEMTEDELI